MTNMNMIMRWRDDLKKIEEYHKGNRARVGQKWLEKMEDPCIQCWILKGLKQNKKGIKKSKIYSGYNIRNG